MSVSACWWICMSSVVVFFFKQKTAYEMRISDWSSDVCSSDLAVARHLRALGEVRDDLVRLSLRRQGTVTGRHEDADLEYSEVMVAVRGPDARRLRLRRQDGR